MLVVDVALVILDRTQRLFVTKVKISVFTGRNPDRVSPVYDIDVLSI